MIYAYGLCQQGTYHIRNGIVCQDAYNIVKCGPNMIVAAVADGLGSEKYSDIAAKLAVKIAVQYCSDKLSPEYDDRNILDVIREAFTITQNAIERTAFENGHESDQYDTTLSLAVLLSGQLYYGHSGDSGIVALADDGIYYKVTEQQRDSDGRVFPLFFREEKWAFGKFEKNVVSVLLATDGIYDLLFPVYLRNENVSIYVALASFFMDPVSLNIEAVGEKTVEESMNRFICGISEEQVNDDKTIAVIMDTAIECCRQPDAYYVEPDWETLIAKYRENWRRLAYPHLFSATGGDIEDAAANEVLAVGESTNQSESRQQ